MNRHKRKIVLFLSLPLILGACINFKQPRNRIDFYTLEYEPSQLNRSKSLPIAIRVERFSVAPIYNTNRIIYRDRSFKRNAYVYYKWWANPGDLVTHFLSRDMKASGLFKAVLPRESRTTYSYRLEGKVNEFLEWDSEQYWEAVLAVSAALVAKNEPDVNKRIIFQRTYRAKERCKEKNPSALAEAMSRGMEKVSGEIIRDIYDELKDR